MAPITDGWQRKKILITVKTYPTPARKGIEVSCTGGITEDGEWIRLFPIPFRFLESDQKFRKYQYIEVNVKKSSDFRPESYQVDIDSLHVVGERLSTKSHWESRKNIVNPLRSPSLCYLQDKRDRHSHPTLGFYKPRKIEQLIIREDSPRWSESDLVRLRQMNFFENSPREELEKIPFKFYYKTLCDESDCTGHELSCTDWEMMQAYRNWRREYGPDWERKFRQRFECDMIEKYDTHFFVGTIHIHPASWINVGLFYPPKVNPSTSVDQSRQLPLI